MPTRVLRKHQKLTLEANDHETKKILQLSFGVFHLFLFEGNVYAENIQIPTPFGDIYVQDFAHLLNERKSTELRSIGRSIENQTTAQMAVLTVRRLGTERSSNLRMKLFGSMESETKRKQRSTACFQQ